jgi:3-oxoacyl-[acyl-carrier-protein] synthase-1
MSAPALAILDTGLVTPVGLSAPASCAAFRAKISNPTETRFIDSGGQWIMAHQVALEQPWRGLTKLAKMAALAIDEAMQQLPQPQWRSVPLLLCLAEAERQGRLDGLDDRLFLQIQEELGATFASDSAIITQGRVGVAVALLQARKLITEGGHARVLIAATDSLLSWPTLSHYEREGRLLTERNSNGFMPGEGAGALLVEAARGEAGEVACSGIGFGREAAHIDSEEPLRADGLTKALKSALADAGAAMHDFDYRITDLAGEQYYFKEAALALSRTLRQRKETFDLWHPAECTGETGAAAGTTVIALAQAAFRKAFSPSPNVLAHMANDAGQRAALALQFKGGA